MICRFSFYEVKFVFVLVLLVGVCGDCFAQKKNKTEKEPPGTIQINDTLFVDKTEIANVHWREYIFYLQKFDSLSLEKALPDTLVWPIDTSGQSLSEYYFSHPGFNDYPVVGISYEQANDFCKWRTFVVNFFAYIKNNELKNWEEHIKDTIPIKLYYRLPTKEEWEIIAAGELSKEKFPYGYDSTYKKWKGRYVHLFNCKYPNDKPLSSKSSQWRFYTAPVNSFFKNTSGTRNMIGNVAEMISEKGIAKGGGFDDKVENCRIIDNQYYSSPESWLGFRCVAVLIK